MTNLFTSDPNAIQLVAQPKRDYFELIILDQITIKVRDFKIVTASYWTNEQILIFVSYSQTSQLSKLIVCLCLKQNLLMDALNSEQLKSQVKALLKAMTCHSILRWIEAKIEARGQEWGNNFASNCSMPTFKHID